MIYVFGDCELDVQRRVMYRAGQVIRLRHKVFQALTYLLTSRDRAVSKEELRQAIWERADDLEPHLAELQRLEFLYERPAIPEPVYTFKHVLGQEAACAGQAERGPQPAGAAL